MISLCRREHIIDGERADQSTAEVKNKSDPISPNLRTEWLICYD
jgi:hypothetical protein